MQVDGQVENGIVRGSNFDEERIVGLEPEALHAGFQAVEVIRETEERFADGLGLRGREVLGVNPRQYIRAEWQTARLAANDPT
jgi:hypothetical protein